MKLIMLAAVAAMVEAFTYQVVLLPIALSQAFCRTLIARYTAAQGEWHHVIDKPSRSHH